MLLSNVSHSVPAPDYGPEPYLAPRLLAGLLSTLAVLVTIVGGLIAVLFVIAGLGSGGAECSVHTTRTVSWIAAAGLAGGALVTLGTVFYALLLWAGAQAIRLLLSIEGQAREAAGVQRVMQAELRRIAISGSRPT